MDKRGQKKLTMDKISSQEDVKQYLRGLGLTVPEEVVRQVVDVARGKVKTSWRSLWKGAKHNGLKPLCAKGTIAKIRKLFEGGRLQSYVAYLDGGGTVQPANNRALPSGLRATDASQEKSKGSAGPTPQQVPKGQSERSPSIEPTKIEAAAPVPSPLRVETPVRYCTPLPPLFPSNKAYAWVLDAHLTNPSKTLPIGVRNIRLEVTRDNETHVVPHLGNSTEGSSGEVRFPEAALPLAVRIGPVETLSGKLRFFEGFGFAEGRVRLDLVFEEADGQIHRHTVSDFFDIPELG